MIDQDRRYVLLGATVCVVAVACCGFAVQAAENEQKIRAELAKPTNIEFNETSLKDAVAYLHDVHGINIQLDEKRLEEVSVPLDTPITKVLKGVSLGSALKLMLEPIGLTYVIEHEVLRITSLDYAQRSATPRVFDVTALAGEGEREALLKAVELVLDRPAAAEGTPPVAAASRMVLFRSKLILRG